MHNDSATTNGLWRGTGGGWLRAGFRAFLLGFLLAPAWVAAAGGPPAAADPPAATEEKGTDTEGGEATGDEGSNPTAPQPATAPVVDPKEVALARGAGVSHLPAAEAFDLEQRRQRIEAREQAVADREEQLATLRDALDQRLDRLTALQRQLDDYLNRFKKEEETHLAQLVKVVGAMRAEAAAASLSQLDERLATLVLARMNEKKAAKIMNVLPPDRAVILAKRMGAAGATGP
ncbi:MAG: hypothetical protein COW73_04405 [Nitrospirae bacterium CG18_big_fil_WC_8_21_14_2_50_70_55]|nr:hypothetical protein [Deltaproteobacteria bacterium]OIP62043.1 MAG: hypothetical protein AUK30_10745 [Nitrospirae bacterium CG2_30_70_394]PIQ05829.1 MAG: hypothetical protein COW73_04405 [Nitrospirae bacterium CG18_big_fil_WC_8_21_14_2_50_70_55]PIU79630.1 MAG: hypothetical protein COS73_03650 [Nitrospirae bacterium CG06_land_8_20_14_3_00_70_43]PIW82914.1 MAG: hypothetical protein COZ96_06115 [Nitrospirae bacterium CG_4_8_14_3_um_filter_70_85]PIX83823.1 MAG: hypothetical protein COZ33_03495 